jgi:predicted pyridoxine 5'-phosphate oxidase superfamily flavin-nucleotide-binding protein
VVTFRVILIIAPDAPDTHELAPVIQHVNDYMGWMLVAALGTSDEGMHPSFLPRPRSQRSADFRFLALDPSAGFSASMDAQRAVAWRS